MSSYTPKPDDTDKVPDNTGDQEQPQEDANINQELVSTDYSILYKCNSCEMSCSDRNEMAVHLQTHSGSKVYECKDCEISLSNLEDWLNHVHNHTVNYFKCKKCGAIIQSLEGLATHIESHDYEKLYQCQYCEYNSPCLNTLRKHLISHKEDRNFKCDECGKTYRHKRNLTRHLKIHKEDRNFKCDKCGKTYRHKYRLTNHLLLHGEDKEFICTRCKKKFENRTSLKMHMNSGKGCKNYFTDLRNHSEVVTTTKPSSGLFSENETVNSLVTVNSLGQGISSESGPETISAPESNSVVVALSGHESQSIATMCSSVEFLACSRSDFDCDTVTSDTPCDSPSNRRSIGTSTHPVPRSQEVEEI